MAEKQTGLFISFEGPDGSGKSTIAKLFYDYLIDQNIDAILTREPGGTNNVVAEAIRKIVLDHHEYEIAANTEALLFAASRAQHTHDVILPALKIGQTVICDRFIDSSLAYQGYARELGYKQVKEINLFATNGKLPEITFFIDVSPEIGLSRIRTNDRTMNRLDAESTIMHKKAYAGYLKIIKKNKKRFVIIDGSKTISEVLENVKKEYKKYVGKK